MRDVIVIGGGHAGVEAALACARLGKDTVLYTMHIDMIDVYKRQIYNRRTVEFFIDQFLAEEGADGCHTMLILDVDDFKNINDTLGHLVGDQALIDLVANIRNNIRRSDILGRIGGDEFVVFLKDTVDDEQIAVISDKISQAVLCSQDIPCLLYTSTGIISPRASRATSQSSIRM